MKTKMFLLLFSLLYVSSSQFVPSLSNNPSAFFSSRVSLASSIFNDVRNQTKTRSEDLDTRDILGLLLKYLTPMGKNVSEICQAASEHYMLEILNANGLALKMFDASAKLPPAGMVSNFITHHPGTFDSCLEVVSEDLTGQHCLLTTYLKDTTLGGGGARIEGQFNDISTRRRQSFSNKFPSSLNLHLRNHERTANMNPEMLFTLFGAGSLKLGRCVPSVCSSDDVAQGFTNFLNGAIDVGDGVNLMDYFEAYATCHTADEKIVLEARDWGMISVIAFFGILVSIGTFVDVILNIFHIDIFSPLFVQIVQGFSIYTNTLKLFNCPEAGSNPSSLDCINGIRFISMSWVLLGHGYAQFLGGLFVNNPMIYIDPDENFMGSGAFAAVANALPSVDSFFLIGSVLLSYMTLKELDKTKGGSISFWIMYFVHRYIRLTGLYAIILGLHATLLKFFSTGIQSGNIDGMVTSCQDDWWSNLLYVNNLRWVAGAHLTCMGQTWYMANDMQFFITSPIIIFALWKNRVVGLGLISTLLLAFTIVPIYVGWVNDFPFSPLIMANGGANPKGHNYMSDFYIVPWCRYQPYLVGLALGYLLHTMRNQPKIKVHPIVIFCIWVLAFIVGCAVIYGLVPYQKDYSLVASTAERALYGGLHRLAWSLALSWVIFACVKGVGGPVNTILAWPFWVPLARMSYCIYLVHMTVMTIVNQYASYRVDISQLLVIYYLIFILLLCIGVSYVLCVLFEAPIVHLEKLLYSSIGLAKLPAVRRIKTD